ncbi:hypothetical protein LX36DRAFT_493510 [Colletotrichum falcatum]|nr:hypothetical protein LX36DRAFT_493510 [Colletotrichum falcatum]
MVKSLASSIESVQRHLSRRISSSWLKCMKPRSVKQLVASASLGHSLPGALKIKNKKIKKDGDKVRGKARCLTQIYCKEKGVTNASQSKRHRLARPSNPTILVSADDCTLRTTRRTAATRAASLVCGDACVCVCVSSVRVSRRLGSIVFACVCFDDEWFRQALIKSWATTLNPDGSL